MLTTLEINKLIEKTEHKINAACADIFPKMASDQYAQLGDAVRAALGALKQELSGQVAAGK